MTGLATLWQRRPATFATSLAFLTILGLVAMLADDGLSKLAGFLCACVPFALAGLNYWRRRAGP